MPVLEIMYILHGKCPPCLCPYLLQYGFISSYRTPLNLLLSTNLLYAVVFSFGNMIRLLWLGAPSNHDIDHAGVVRYWLAARAITGNSYLVSSSAAGRKPKPPFPDALKSGYDLTRVIN